jgi:predicted dehydrogenase
MKKRLGIGFIGSGFIARFHIRSFLGVRDADILGVWSPNLARAREAAELANEIGVGEASAYESIEALVNAPGIEAIWICGPNFARVENIEKLSSAIRKNPGKIRAVACEKPLGRNVQEAKLLVKFVEEHKLLHGYLEDQLFEPAIVRGREIIWRRGAALTGRPYLARAAEEHSGPHMPWFWQGSMQGGGVLNDMMCHSVEVARYLLTEPGKPRSSITPVKISASIASLKWSRPEYVELLKRSMGSDVDYAKRPAEDFARATIFYQDDSGTPLVSEVTTSWSYVGAGLRLSTELLGPEYSMSVNTLDTGLKLFFSRNVKGSSGEDLVEKQNAEQGLMPVVANEAAEYGYEGENRYFTQCFSNDTQPEISFYDGLAVTELLMAAYRSAEEDRTIALTPGAFDDFIPSVARGDWNPNSPRG